MPKNGGLIDQRKEEDEDYKRRKQRGEHKRRQEGRRLDKTHLVVESKGEINDRSRKRQNKETLLCDFMYENMSFFDHEPDPNARREDISEEIWRSGNGTEDIQRKNGGLGGGGDQMSRKKWRG